MRVPKPLAIAGFHFCVTIFVGLAIYGLIRYLNEGLLQSDSTLAMASYSIGILASVGGICFFGREADLRKAEEIRNAVPPPPPSPRKKKKSNQ